MKGMIVKTALALALSAGASVAIAQTDQPQILKKKPGQQTEQQMPSKGAEKQPGTAAEGQAGTEPMKKPGEQTEGQAQAPAEQKTPATEEKTGSDATKPDQQKEGQAQVPAEEGTQQDGTAADQQADQPKTEGTAETEQKPAPTDNTAETPAQPSDETTASVDVTVEQKTEIKQVITETKVEPVRDIDVDISVGVAVPRTIEVHQLPPRIIEIVPAYRNYVYFVLADGRIVILEPDTYEIVVILV
ncbi:DUF1236 domain-containing protein [Mesorhizobium sp. ZC-5]|uniref:DUF1236 domain-containing protein n=1 Tax=Mesorhizobium sp. ZC-5 TaxID=2986066 RepID=UPI0021E6FCE4|nr:DUF1236 domain-containing protein [Mesorhizobium sp. ZC-5]MCV3241779.1 DUF1236 domain-containing protein [Mesorhizobium sp. ZC-5]